MKRRYLLQSMLVAGVAPMAFVPRLARGAIFKPEDFGPVGQGNDTAALQGAINAVRQDGKGSVELRRSLDFGAINSTYCPNLEIHGEIGAVHTCLSLAQPAAIFDLCHSPNAVLDRIVMTLPPPGVTGVVYPKAAFLLHGSDKTTMRNVTVNGTASSGTLCVIGASSISVRDSQFINYDPNAPTVVLSNEADWGITSLFKSGSLVTQNMPDVYFENTERHAIGGAPWTTYMRNADHIVFRGGISSNRNSAHALFQGYCHHITSDSEKFYKGDVGSYPHAQMVFQCSGGSSVSGMVVINPSRDGIPALHNGAGYFPYLSVIPVQS